MTTADARAQEATHLARTEADPTAPAPAPAPREPEVEPAPFVRLDSESGLLRLDLVVEGVHCAACIRRIERTLGQLPFVRAARVNLSSRRCSVAFAGDPEGARAIVSSLAELGYRAVPFDPAKLDGADAAAEKELLLCLAVAGFAAGNIMLLAVSVWSGHFVGMGEATRTFLHWFEALIALPAIAFSGRPFFRSALAALRRGRTNMDVPISLAVILAPAVSLVETIRMGDHAYFDSAVTLLFFLLIGRYLDRRARGAAREAVARLLALRAQAVTRIEVDGTMRAVRPESLEPGQEILVATGERVGVDGEVVAGRGELDTSLVTGETVPQPVEPGSRVFAGTVNLGPPLRVRVLAAGEGTLLAEIVRLMEAAEQRRSRFVALADRVARLYAPFVHTLAALTLTGWLLAGAEWHFAMMSAIAVLIITCPCALGLAVPAVQVIAAGRLLRHGVLVKSATALERFARIDTVVFDKTGTLTTGRMALEAIEGGDASDLEAAAGLARTSRHPLARALAAAAGPGPARTGVEEVPGTGLRWCGPEGEWRLGRRGFAASVPDDDRPGAELWFSRPHRPPVRFRFADPLRPDAAEVVAALRARGLALELLSGDRPATVAEVAQRLGIEHWRAGLAPAEKVARLEELARLGRKVLMVGDGLNDAPALSAASVSLSPASAVDVSQTAADAVFQGERLFPVLEVLEVARRAERLVRQNIAMSIVYNLCAVPLAVAGFVTPLVAAIAMSSSSLLVVGNSLRLRLRARTEPAFGPARPPRLAEERA
ncbi:MAG: heavy metal translocating P-type ATPase [Geminicoccaceae bacterium]|nr:heavy metal translocating P-type ATPase [Geminicoccaceae bacterium]